MSHIERWLRESKPTYLGDTRNRDLIELQELRLADEPAPMSMLEALEHLVDVLAEVVKQPEQFRGCWSCGAHGPNCEPGCECARCVDPVGYAEWKRSQPEQYAAWWERQRLAPHEGCDCPSCQARWERRST